MTQICQNTIFSSIYDTYLLDILDQDQLTLLPGARGLLIEGYIYRYSIGMYVVTVGYLPSYYHHTTYNHVLMPHHYGWYTVGLQVSSTYHHRYYLTMPSGIPCNA